MVLLMDVRGSSEEAVDQETFAEQLASALNYSVAAAEVLVEVRLLPDVCNSEASVRAAFIPLTHACSRSHLALKALLHRRCALPLRCRWQRSPPR